jgi:hypothetical protein
MHDHTLSLPAPLEANPGIGTTFEVGFSNDEREWSESGDLIEILSAIMHEAGHRFERQEKWIAHDSGFMIQPQLVELTPRDDGRISTVSTVECHHPQLLPQGTFEYQHSIGENTTEALRSGLKAWAATDFVALLAAASGSNDTCMTMQMTLPAENGQPERGRRIVFGPVSHYRQHPPAEAEATAEATDPAGSPDNPHDSEDGFCPCCLFTRSIDAFEPLLKTEGTLCLRLFAFRDNEGETQSDCRLNGEDWTSGTEALRRYAETWPQAGMEFRKQYVIIHDDFDVAADSL